MQESESERPKVRVVEVTDAEAGQRIDNFLIRRARGVPRSAVYRVIRTGQVRVNSGRVKPTRKLAVGDLVRIPPLQLKPSVDVTVPDSLAVDIEQRIIVEHADFLVVDKPAGIAVHGGSGLAFGLIDALRQIHQDPKLELVHRLDRGTSGCLLVARNLKQNRRLQNLFRERLVDKRYQALVAGVWQDNQVRIDAPLASNRQHAGERRVMVAADGQPAVSHFTCLQRFTDASLLEVRIDTGRTHQIRVHAKHAGHAVVGDTRYGDNYLNKKFRQRGFKRLFLHAASLSFQWHDENIHVAAPPDSQWLANLAGLRQ